MNVKLRVANPVDLSGATIEATVLLDRGATFTTIPRDSFEKLGLRAIGTRKVRTATQFESLEQSHIC